MMERDSATTAGPPDAEVFLDQFDAAWRSDAAPDLSDFLPPAGPLRARVLEELIKIDLEYRWRGLLSGSTGPLLEAYLARAAELGLAIPFSLDLIGEEYWVRHRWGDRPGVQEYLRRFADRADVLAPLLARIDAELANEFLRSRPAEPSARQAASTEPIANPDIARPITTVHALIAYLDGSALLQDSQRSELHRSLVPRFAELRSLAKELLARQWLTVFQMNRILQGRGSELQIGPHVLLDRLGEGATGWVYKARHVGLRRLVAVKVLREHLLGDPEALVRFYREIQVVSQLAHPHVIHAYDAGPVEGKHVLVMEYVNGQDLLTLVREEGPLGWEQAREFVGQAARGLQHIHENGLIHRDVKPSNLLLGKTSVHGEGRGVVKVLDLGLARLGRVGRQPGGRRLSSGASGRLTPRQALGVGTPDFMAPEQALDFHSADARADIYSLGCTLFFLLTGHPPFPGGTAAGKLLRHQEESPHWEMLPASVPQAGLHLLRLMLNKAPQHRPPTAGDVCRGLTSEVALVVTGPANPVAVAPPSASDLTDLLATRPARSSRRAAVLVPLLVLGLVGLTVASIACWQRESPSAATNRKRVIPAVQARPSSLHSTLLSFERGFATPNGLKCNGSARAEGGRLLLTDNGSQAGSVFTAERLPVEGFSTEFDFEIRGKLGEMADGLTFTIQATGADALGSPGGGLGYGPDPSEAASNARIDRSVALKFDLYDNNGEGTNSTGLYENGASPGALGSVNLHGSGIDLHSQHIFHVRIRYADCQLGVTIMDTATGTSHTHTYRVNLPAVIGSPKAYVGFTAGTGGLSAQQAILRWTFAVLDDCPK